MSHCYPLAPRRLQALVRRPLVRNWEIRTQEPPQHAKGYANDRKAPEKHLRSEPPLAALLRVRFRTERDSPTPRVRLQSVRLRLHANVEERSEVRSKGQEGHDRRARSEYQRCGNGAADYYDSEPDPCDRSGG